MQKMRLLGWLSAGLAAIAAIAVVNSTTRSTACNALSETEAIELARTHLSRDATELASMLSEQETAFANPSVVQFIDWRPSIVFNYGVTFQLESERLITVSISSGCGRELSFPDRLSPPV